MKFFRTTKCKEILVGLAENFYEDQKMALSQKVAANDHDFIDRGLYNTTHRVGQLVQIHNGYISDLINFLLNSIEEDYPHMSPTKCKPHMHNIIERKYEKLAREVPSWLQQSQFLDQKMIRSFQEDVQKKKVKAKSSLDKSCRLWDERWKRQKRKKRIDLVKFLIGPGVVVVFILFFVTYFINEGKVIEVNIPMQNTSKVLSVDPNTGRTPLNVRTRERVEKLKEFIINEKVDPWLFMEISDFRVTKADGRVIAYSGIKYSGSPVLVFWSEDYIDPFLKEGFQKILDETGKECRENKIKAEEPLKEASAMLRGLIWNVYDRMAEVDSRLRKRNAGSDSVSKVDVTDRAQTMDKYLREQLNAALELYAE